MHVRGVTTVYEGDEARCEEGAVAGLVAAHLGVLDTQPKAMHVRGVTTVYEGDEARCEEGAVAGLVAAHLGVLDTQPKARPCV
jgi:hypothetical protein